MFPYAITIHQPNANAIMRGTKREEYRSWYPVARLAGGVYAKPLHVPFALLIHAGSLKCAPIGAKGPFSAFLAVALFSSVTHQQGYFAWHVARVYRFKTPVPCTGHPSLWKPSLPIRISILAALDCSAAAWLLDYFPKSPNPQSTGPVLPDELPLELEAPAQWAMQPLFA